MSENVTARPAGRRPRPEERTSVLPPLAAAPLAAAMLALVLLFLAQQFGIAITPVGPAALIVLLAAGLAVGAVQLASRRSRR